MTKQQIICDKLAADGWRAHRNQFKAYAVCFYKNSFLFWYHNRDAGVFQARILVVQFGFKKPKKKEVYVA